HNSYLKVLTYLRTARILECTPNQAESHIPVTSVICLGESELFGETLLSSQGSTDDVERRIYIAQNPMATIVPTASV
ncbi:MAG: hypothetical protein AAF560_21415, partial [Acidobacteriota bacterium]